SGLQPGRRGAQDIATPMGRAPLVQQNAQQRPDAASGGRVLEDGGIALEGTGPSMLNDSHVRRVYLGV
ncbi:MAG: hypothetical protein KA063_04635, partial [Firmicutes bacterium]|nr:hypothetical protein [Bacillota bacterium]